MFISGLVPIRPSNVDPAMPINGTGKEEWKGFVSFKRQLAKSQGSNPSHWRVSANPERISFVPGLLPFTMRYTNRATGIQQVLSVSGHSKQDTGR